MATLKTLTDAQILRRLEISLSKGLFRERDFLCTPDFMQWLNGDLKRMKQIDTLMITPAKQVFGLLQTYITGQPLTHGRQFHILNPEKHDVWELKTPDVRIFGWFHERNRFIAVKGASMEECKNDGYAQFRDEVVAYRISLDLDEPKYKQGAKVADVISV